MNYKTALVKLEALLILVKKVYNQEKTSKEDYENLCMLYGTVEEVINQFAGITQITVPVGNNLRTPDP